MLCETDCKTRAMILNTRAEQLVGPRMRRPKRQAVEAQLEGGFSIRFCLTKMPPVVNQINVATSAHLKYPESGTYMGCENRTWIFTFEPRYPQSVCAVALAARVL